MIEVSFFALAAYVVVESARLLFGAEFATQRDLAWRTLLLPLAQVGRRWPA